MKLQINFNTWGNATSNLLSTSNTFSFTLITSIVPEPETPYRELSFSWDSNTNNYKCVVFNLYGSIIATYHGSEIQTNLGNNAIIECNYLSTVLNRFYELHKLNLINLDVEGITNVLTYRLIGKKNVVSKSLDVVGVMSGNFKAPLGIKNIELDVINYDIKNSYNYVFIASLNRFYYVTNIQLINKDYTKLLLQEDVLMSWSDLIRLQNAFVTRYENSGNNFLVDVRRPLKDIQTVSKVNLSPTPSATSKVNTTFTLSTDSSIPNFLIATKIKWGILYGYNVDTPSLDDGYLPTLAPHNAPQQKIYFMKRDDVDSMFEACIKDDATATYLDAIMWLPFDPTQPFNLNAPAKNNLYIGDKQLYHSVSETKFVDRTQGLTDAEKPTCSYDTVDTYRNIYQSVYLCIFDGKWVVNTTDDDYWEKFEPYSHYELYVPFVGYVDIQSRDFFNKRILVYYTMDIKTGQATAYIYNEDDHIVIWSGGCQLGFKLDVTQTNTLENTKQKQSLDLNMILGLVSSAVSIGIGVASENPVAIVGGVLSAGKTIASNVNANRMIFNKGQTTYGSYDGSLYSLMNVFLRWTYNDEIYMDSTTKSIYKKLQGLPYNEYKTLWNLSGYVEIGDMTFESLRKDIYSAEIDEIVALLKGGVIL